MSSVRRHLHVVGFRVYPAEQPNEVEVLQSLFFEPLAPAILDFLKSLADCVLYYRFDATTKTGKTKTYSHFVLTNIGPYAGEPTYQPASLVGFVRRYRECGLPTYYLPLVNQVNATSWLYCDIRMGTGHPIVKHSNDVSFTEGGRGWTTVSPDFDSFVNGLKLDLKPLLSVFRIAGLGGIQEPMRDWFEAVLGEDWEEKIRLELTHKTKKRTSRSSSN